MRPSAWPATVAGALVATLLGAAPAAAFTPPDLYVRLGHANSIDHTPASDWMPLSAAPRLNWLGGYQIGYARQAAPGNNNTQRAALEITGVPDGQATQPLNEPFCTGGPGAVGEITPVGTEIQFEGSGTYTVKVSVGPPSGGAKDCMTAADSASSTATFTVDVPAAASVVGSPLTYRNGAPPAAFVGISTPPAPGGSAETVCARDATVQADGSVTGSPIVPVSGEPATAQIAESRFYGLANWFERPGAYTCVGRGAVEGRDANLDAQIFGTPWSAPLKVDVRSDFRRARGLVSGPKSKTPKLRFTAEFPEAAPGGTGTLLVKRLVRCRGANYVFKKVGSYKARFDAKGRADVKLRRPRTGFYTGTLSFSGTRFYTKSVDPNIMLLGVSAKGKLGFLSSQGFPQCPGFP